MSTNKLSPIHSPTDRFFHGDDKILYFGFQLVKSPQLFTSFKQSLLVYAEPAATLPHHVVILCGPSTPAFQNQRHDVQQQRMRPVTHDTSPFYTDTDSSLWLPLLLAKCQGNNAQHIPCSWCKIPALNRLCKGPIKSRSTHWLTLQPCNLMSQKKEK